MVRWPANPAQRKIGVHARTEGNECPPFQRYVPIYLGKYVPRPDQSRWCPTVPLQGSWGRDVWETRWEICEVRLDLGTSSTQYTDSPTSVGREGLVGSMECAGAWGGLFLVPRGRLGETGDRRWCLWVVFLPMVLFLQPIHAHALGSRQPCSQVYWLGGGGGGVERDCTQIPAATLGINLVHLYQPVWWV